MSTPIPPAADLRTRRFPRADRQADGPLSGAGWALSMAVADRRNLVRLAVMAVGIALCTFVLFALATISPLVNSMNGRADASTPHPIDGTGQFQSLPVSVQVDGQTVGGMVLRASAARPPAPPGTARFPSDGELLASPALAEMLADPTRRTLRSVVAGAVVGVIDAGVLPGGHDLFFYQGSDSLVGGLDADRWGVPAGEHPLDPRVWSMLITGVIIVMVPLLLFTALAGRIGSARRDRRSATLRLLGASTSRLRLLIAGEALIAATLGVILAVAAYAAARLVTPSLRIGGRGIQAGDLTPGTGTALAILVGVPLLAAVAASIGFRVAADDPLTVVNRGGRRPRAGWRIAVLVSAIVAACWAQKSHSSDSSSSGTAVVEMCVVVALSLFAVAAVVGLVTDRVARSWVGGSVAGVLGRRRIIQDGATTTRAAAALATVLAGFVVLMTVLSGTHYSDLQAQAAGPTSYWGSASGLTSADWNRLQSSLDKVPGVQSVYLISTLAGSATTDRPQLSVATCASIRAMITDQQCRDGDSFHLQLPGQPPLPAGPFKLQLPSGSVATWTPPPATRNVVPTATSDQSILMPTDYVLTPAAAERQFPGALPQQSWVQVVVQMPASSADEAQQAVSWLGWRSYSVLSLSAASAADLNSSPVPWIRAGLIGCGVLTLLICALGQALMGAEQISERRRAFALARASGVPLSVLSRSVMHAALLPVAVGVVLAAATGALLAPYVQYLRGSIWMPPTWPWILLGSAAALLVAVAVTGASHLTLRNTTGPGALRTE